MTMRRAWVSSIVLALCFSITPAFAQKSSVKKSSANEPSPKSESKDEAQATNAARPLVRDVREVTVRDETFHSPSLARDEKYRVILPAGYGSSNHRYPVLYLLHGAMGSYVDWETKSHVVETFHDLPLIVVMPEGAEAWYTNSATVPQDRYEDYIVKDLVQDVEDKFRAIRAQYGRAIAGLSMGGYGATKFALKYPNMFAVAASFSGAFEVPNGIERLPESNFHNEWLKIFGPATRPGRSDEDPIQLIQKVSASVVPYLWLSCGTSDHLLDYNREVVHALQQHKIAYEYHETPGDHTWEYWDEQLRAFRPTLVERLKLR
jgi:putative tributyrin esterase